MSDILHLYIYITIRYPRDGIQPSINIKEQKNLGFTEAPLFLYQIMNGGRYNARPWHVSPGALRSKGERSTRKKRED